MKNTYQNLFESWDDVQLEFGMEEPEPDQVILATYEYEDYSGTADVIYRDGDKYYWVRGSHCSCNGLEGQWEPEEYTKELLIKSLEKGGWKEYVKYVKKGK